MRKATKLAQIRLEAFKHEAELRAREVQLENECRIKEQQLQGTGPIAPSFAPRPPLIQNQGAVSPTAPSFTPRDNSGQTSTPNILSTAEDPGQKTRRTACYGYQPKKALLQVLPVIVHGKDGKQTEVLAMLDSGCDCTLISAGKAYELGLVLDQENSQKVTITGVNGTNTVLPSPNQSIYRW